MKISICIPQFNRIEFLVESLTRIQLQEYANIEVVVSDDASTDTTYDAIEQLVITYRFPIVYGRNEVNKGYDYNWRKTIEMASGDYVLILGNDDSLNNKNGIGRLVEIIEKHHFPDLGFCNFIEERTGNTVFNRASNTEVIEGNVLVASKFYSCFGFVGGLIFNRKKFLEYNTNKCDGSVYSQIYIAVLMIASGKRMISIAEPLIVKDILVNSIFRHSYRNRLAKDWKDYRIVDAGLPTIIGLFALAISDAKRFDAKALYRVFSRIYSYTYPHWLLDYRENSAFPEAIGLVNGMALWRSKDFKRLNFYYRIAIRCRYYVSTIVGLFTPVFIFKKLRVSLYNFLKR